MAVYAHSKENAPISEWQTLEEHLVGTARRASQFASSFSSSFFGYILGMLHDIGKSRRGFQSYLRRSNGIEESPCDGLGEWVFLETFCFFILGKIEDRRRKGRR